MSDNIPHIHDEIATEILKRVDCKTLVKCTCVCKRWKSIITSPSFISLHLDFASTTQTHTLFLQVCSRENDLGYREHYSVREDDSAMELLFPLEEPPLHRFKNKWSFFKVLGSCNGLVCIIDSLIYSFILWNPTCRRYILLPRFHSPLVDRGALGFGFDSRHNDFKVVVLINGIINVEAWVCSFTSRSWKRITSQVNPCVVLEGTANTLVNGKLHWVAKHRRNERQKNFVLTLDLAQETFRQISLPQRIGEEESMASIHVFTRGESLAVSHVEDVLASPSLCIWVMEEYGVVESWTRILKIGNEQLIPKNVAFIWNNGEIVLEMRNGNILKYNPTTTIVEDLGFRGNHVFIGYHKQSLFLFDKGRGIMSYTY